MTPQHVISQLLKSDATNLKNIDLLKKITLTAYFGRLQVNGQSPDNQIAFANYLFDQEHVMFDFSHISDEKRAVFEKWLLEAHQEEKETSYFKNTAVNEYRGFTAESRLRWWGRIKRWFYGHATEHWKINDIDLSLHYQLLGVDLCHGQQGVLVGFQQFLVPPTGTKYKSNEDQQEEPLGNTKRVFITDTLVDQLTKLNLRSINFETICKSAHPHAITVRDYKTRYEEMKTYRVVQQFRTNSIAWYHRFWNWLVSLFKSEPNKVTPVNKAKNTKLSLLYENDTTTVYQRSNREILVKEKRPDIENLVYCGGGAKIFAHIGVWKALNEAHIVPKKFAGSSAGAIMGLMCYLGYPAEKIADLFKPFRKEHIVYFNMTSKGLADPQAIKTALDYAIALKVKEIVTDYNIPYPQGKITFATLEALRIKCPGCGLGEELIVTATNKNSSTTKYFSFHKTPNMEVSEAVKISSSIPVLFRDTRVDGDDYNDGGVLNNFPTEAFHADDTTFLESEYGNNMKTLAVQFDNGTERAAVDRGMDRVHRQNFFWNWAFGLLAGVKDPASGWEKDLMKLRKYSAQSIITDVGSTTATSFSVEDNTQKQLIQNGYRSAKNYLQARYAQKDGGPYRNKEIMHSTFSSLEELLAYCCYKGNKEWFDRVSRFIKSSSLPNKAGLMKQASKLRALYFRSASSEGPRVEGHTPTFFGNNVVQQFFTQHNNKDHEVFLALYPIFLMLSPRFLKNTKEYDMFDRARHSFTVTSPFACLEHFARIKDDTHVLFHIFHNLVKELQREHATNFENAEHMQSIFNRMALINKIVGQNDLFKADYYGKWDLDLAQENRILQAFDRMSPRLGKLCESLKYQSAPTKESERVLFSDAEPEVSTTDHYACPI